MDIHPPAGPVESVKHFFLYLSMIAIGILIALGLESTVETLHHKALVREARQNLISEIAANRRELDRVLAKTPLAKDQVKHIADAIKSERKWRGASRTAGEFKLSLDRLTLHSASWTTAHDTGALQYMPYQEVKHFAELYRLQDQLLNLQDRTLTNWADLQKIAFSLDKNVFTRFTDQDLATVEYQTTGALCAINEELSVAQALSSEYAKFAK
jgi:hypothetical protein